MSEQPRNNTNKKKLIDYCLFDIDTNYFSFISGVISTIAIEEIFALLDMVICDNVSAFLFELLNTFVFSFMCFIFLKFFVNLTSIKAKLEKKPIALRYEYLYGNIDTEFKENYPKLITELNLIKISVAIALVLTVIQFILNNIPA